MKLRSSLLIICGCALLLTSFQNCGKGFESSIGLSKSSLCQAKIREQAQKLSWSASALRCGDMASYVCERRVFSPDVEDMSHVLTECVSDGGTCVEVQVRQFNTSVARTPAADASEFQPGGSYNHEEVKCYHRQLYQGLAIFSADGDSLAEALSGAMASCEAAAEGA